MDTSYKNEQGELITVDLDSSTELELLKHLKEIQREIKRWEEPIEVTCNSIKNFVLCPRGYGGRALDINNSHHSKEIKDWLQKCIDEISIIRFHNQLPNGSPLSKYENSSQFFEKLSELCLELSRACKKQEENIREKEYYENLKLLEKTIKKKIGIN